MPFLAPARRAGKILARSFVRPWRDKTRAFLMIATCPALFAAGVQGLALIYNMAGEGVIPATLFHFFRMLLLGTLAIPATFWLLARPFGRTAVGALQILGGALLLIDQGSVLFNGLGYVLTAGPFWALFSQRNAFALSSENHGHETAFLLYLQTIVLAAGSFSGGLLLDLDLYKTAMVLSSLGYLISTMLYAKPLPKQPIASKAFHLIGWKKPATRLTFFAAALFALIDNGLPTWMRIIGLSPLSTGIQIAMRPLLGLVLTPIAGSLVQKGGLSAGRAGGVALCGGWVILGFASVYHGLLLPALALTAIGTGLISPLEVNRWFKRRSVPAIVAREWILASGRASFLPIVIPATFLAAPVYPLLGLVAALGFMLGIKERRKKSARL